MLRHYMEAQLLWWEDGVAAVAGVVVALLGAALYKPAPPAADAPAELKPQAAEGEGEGEGRGRGGGRGGGVLALVGGGGGGDAWGGWGDHVSAAACAVGRCRLNTSG